MLRGFRLRFGFWPSFAILSWLSDFAALSFFFWRLFFFPLSILALNYKTFQFVRDLVFFVFRSALAFWSCLATSRRMLFLLPRGYFSLGLDDLLLF